MDAKKGKFTTLVFVLMIGAVIVLVLALWSGFGFVLAQNGGDIVKTITGEIGTIILVLVFMVGMIFTLRKKLWGYWVFGITSVLMFIGLAIPGMGETIHPLGPAGFLGVSAVALIYRQRDLLS